MHSIHLNLPFSKLIFLPIFFKTRFDSNNIVLDVYMHMYMQQAQRMKLREYCDWRYSNLSLGYACPGPVGIPKKK